MKKYTLNQNVQFFAASPKNADLDFRKHIYDKYGYVTQSVTDISDGSKNREYKQVIDTQDKNRVLASNNEVLLIPGSEPAEMLLPIPKVMSQYNFQSLFSQVLDDETSNGNQHTPDYNGTATDITDTEYRDAAIRACIYMEHGVKNGNTPVKAENVSGDKGGLTKYGISQAAFPNLDIANLTYDDAVKIYADSMWIDSKANLLPRPLNALTFDLRVTSGPKNAIRILQRAIGTGDDGIWGPKTLAAAQEACSTIPKMIAATMLFTQKRIAYYQAIVKNNPSQSKFLNGWINRAVKSEAFSLALCYTLDIL